MWGKTFIKQDKTIFVILGRALLLNLFGFFFFKTVREAAVNQTSWGRKIRLLMTHRRSEKERRAEGWVKKSSQIGFHQRIKCAIGGQAAIKPLTGWSPAYGRKRNTRRRLQNRWQHLTQPCYQVYPKTTHEMTVCSQPPCLVNLKWAKVSPSDSIKPQTECGMVRWACARKGGGDVLWISLP